MHVCYYHVAYAVAWTSTNTLLEIGAMSEVYVIKVCDRKREQHLKVLFTFIPWLLNLPSYGLELKKRYTLRLLLMCLLWTSFGNCFAWDVGVQMTQVREGVEGNYVN